MKKQVLSFGIAILLVLIATVTFSQSWDKKKPNILYAKDKNGDTTGVRVGIGTANPNYSLDVKGKIFTDSLHVLKNIKIGNSIWLGLTDQFSATNDIFSDNGPILIQCNPGYPYHTIFNWDYGTNSNNGSVGIGTSDPFGSLSGISGLEVTGDINITSANMYPSYLNHGFRINGVTVLQI